jgi:YD repeat-containing protein
LLLPAVVTAVGLGGVLLVGSGVTQNRKAEPCPAGRYVVVPGSAPLLASTPTGERDVVVIDTAGHVAIESGCEEILGKVRARRKATRVRALWATCGEAERVRLRARILAPVCTEMRGRVKAKKTRRVKFTAIRSTCGDGIIDPDAGEVCEPALDDCPAGTACSAACVCEVAATTTLPPGTTSTSLVPTTTTTSSVPVGSTTSTTFPDTPPPDPATIAPDADLTVATMLYDTTRFLYEGDPRVQFNVAEGAIDPRRAAVIRGRVLTRDGTPLPAVRIGVHRHPELGGTLSRANGAFDLVVNGGGALTLDYGTDGFLPAQRTLDVPWAQWVTAPDVVLVPLDPQVTMVEAGAPVLQTAIGSPVTDEDGARQAMVMFPAGTTATMVLPDGTTQALESLAVRATEYTVGDRGPEAMPAALPPTSGYTYAVELSVDAALGAGATRVDFNQPLPTYVDNFLGFPVGGKVPAGYYDRDRAAWIASRDGRVIEILSTAGGLAALDVDGSGLAADAAALAALGITDAERAALATTRSAGDTLWRVPIPHFTPWDYNWPFGLPDDAVSPDATIDGADSDGAGDGTGTGTSCTREVASALEPRRQVLGETLPVAGTPFTLHYRSDRVPGRTSARTMRVRLSGSNVPASLDRIEVHATIAGRVLAQTFAPGPNLVATLTWDGRDAYGRVMQGPQPVRGEVSFLYPAVYREPADFEASFGTVGEAALSANPTRQEIAVTRPFAGSLGVAWDARAQALGGWTLDALHAYDVAQRTLHLGSGETRRAAAFGDVLAEVFDRFDDNRSFYRLATAPDGTLFVGDASGDRIYRRELDGTMTHVAGTGCHPGNCGPPADGTPGLEANLDTEGGLALAPDGSLFIGAGCQVFRLAPDGLVYHVAGRSSVLCSGPPSGDGGPAVDADLTQITDIALGPDGSLYIVYGHGLRRVGPDGIITSLGGGFGVSPDGTRAVDARYNNPRSVVVGTDGTVYLAESWSYRIRSIEPDGILRTVAGTGSEGFSGDGGPATAAQLGWVNGLALAPDGRLILMEVYNTVSSCRLRAVRLGGTITTIAGRGECSISLPDQPPPGDLALRYALPEPQDVAVAPDGTILTVTLSGMAVIRPGLAGLGSGMLAVPSADGHELFEFDTSGRHLRTRETRTGAVRYEFAYDDASRVVQVTDGDGNVTTIERDAVGTPTAIVAPRGQRTGLGIDDDGYLGEIRDPAGASWVFTYATGGLLVESNDPRGHVGVYVYDSGGRLTDTLTVGAAGEGEVNTLVREPTTGGFSVRHEWAFGTTNYGVARSVVAPAATTAFGDATESQIVRTAGTRTVTTTDGTTLVETIGPDPRWGLQAPVEIGTTVATPGGITLTAAAERTAALADPANPLSLQTETRTLEMDGVTWTSIYDAATRTATLTTPTGRQRTVTSDALGRVARLALPGLAPITTSYDAQGRLVALTRGEGAAARTIGYGYDGAGHLVSVTDPLGRTQTFTHDAAGRVLTQTLGDGGTIGFGWDARGNLTSYTPPGRPAYGFTYTPTNLHRAFLTPDAGDGPALVRYDYDIAGQVTSVTRADGRTLALGYGPGGRVGTVDTSRGTTTYGYDAAGRLASLVTPEGTGLAFAYDGFVPLAETLTGEVAGTVSRTYASFRTTGLAVNGDEVAYAHDADGLLVSAGALGLVHDPANGLLAATTLGDLADTFTHDAFGDVATHAVALGGAPALFTAAYERNAAGQLTRRVETLGGVATETTYAYDLVGRLARVEIDGTAAAEYAYDLNGNRLHDGTRAATYDVQDRLLSYGTTTYTHGADGERATRTTGAGTTTYFYDELGNLLEVGLPGGDVLRYVVDGQQRRVGKRRNGVLERGWLYQDDLNVVAELDETNAVVARFVYATRAHVPDYMVKNGATYRLVTDPVGSVRLVVDAADGTIAQRLEYGPFGEVLVDTNPGFQPFGFAGGSTTRIPGCTALGRATTTARWGGGRRRIRTASRARDRTSTHTC